MSENNSGSMMAGILVGAAIGAGLALMFAPRTGSETRRYLGDAARRLGNGTKGQVDEVVNVVQGVAGDVGAAIDVGKEAFRNSAERAAAQLERV